MIGVCYCRKIDVVTMLVVSQVNILKLNSTKLHIYESQMNTVINNKWLWYKITCVYGTKV